MICMLTKKTKFFFVFFLLLLLGVHDQITAQEANDQSYQDVYVVDSNETKAMANNPLLVLSTNTNSSQNDELWEVQTTAKEQQRNQKEEFTASLLETTGFQTTSNLYITFVSIGLLADAYSKGIYQKETVEQICSQYGNLLAGNRERLQKMQSYSFLSADDRLLLKDMSEIYVLLLQENNALRNLVRSEDDKYLQKYSEAHQQAWEKIKKLLQWKE